jgi:hypothetical protein
MTRSASKRFHELLREIGELHDRKQADYGSEKDPLANVRASEEWGIPAWVGALIRLNDKVNRLKAFARKRSLANESAEDSMVDIAVYALIARILYEQEAKEWVEWPAGTDEELAEDLKPLVFAPRDV